MNQTARVGDLEIHQDLSQERLEWRIERIAWMVMAAVLLAAIAGLLGPGPLSRASASVHGVQVQYNRFARYQAPEALRVQIAPVATSNGMVRLWLDSRFVRDNELNHIDPEPASVGVGSDRYIYEFSVPNDSEPVTLNFRYEPKQFGTSATSMGIVGGAQLTFTQFIYP